MEQLKGLKKDVKGFASELIEDGNAAKNLKITKQNLKLFSEGAWLHLLVILNFWMEDDSPGFEKTDVTIEKLIHAAFDIFENTPLDNIVDFGKFIFKEKLA